MSTQIRLLRTAFPKRHHAFQTTRLLLHTKFRLQERKKNTKFTYMNNACSNDVGDALARTPLAGQIMSKSCSFSPVCTPYSGLKIRIFLRFPFPFVFSFKFAPPFSNVQDLFRTMCARACSCVCVRTSACVYMCVCLVLTQSEEQPVQIKRPQYVAPVRIGAPDTRNGRSTCYASRASPTHDIN